MSTTTISLFCITVFLHTPFVCVARPITTQISEAIRWTTEEENSTGQLGNDSCRTGNPIDDCWRCDPKWDTNRKVLADCAIGFGRNAIGGRDGELYTVNSSDDNSPKNPIPGMLRHALIQQDPSFSMRMETISMYLP